MNATKYENLWNKETLNNLKQKCTSSSKRWLPSKERERGMTNANSKRLPLFTTLTISGTLNPFQNRLMLSNWRTLISRLIQLKQSKRFRMSLCKFHQDSNGAKSTSKIKMSARMCTICLLKITLRMMTTCSGLITPSNFCSGPCFLLATIKIGSLVLEVERRISCSGSSLQSLSTWELMEKIKKWLRSTFYVFINRSEKKDLPLL